MMHLQQLPDMSRKKARKQKGFTLIELLVTLAILAMLLAAVVPSFSDIVMKGTLTSQARDLMGGVILARSEAIKRSQAMTLCASSNAATCTDDSWSKGWIVISSLDNTIIHKHKAVPDGFMINSPLKRITFSASGLGATMATLTICRATPTVGRQERVVSIGATGRPSMTKTETGTCAP